MRALALTVTLTMAVATFGVQHPCVCDQGAAAGHHDGADAHGCCASARPTAPAGPTASPGCTDTCHRAPDALAESFVPEPPRLAPPLVEVVQSTVPDVSATLAELVVAADRPARAPPAPLTRRLAYLQTWLC